MFHKEFYPTPINVLDAMQIDCVGRTVLEPSAGKGDIVDYLYHNGATEVLAIEINEDLRKIVSSKCNLIGNDFFNCKAEHISHINLIVMNPPFSNAEKHIVHAFDIAPEGCEIIALCNYETISKSYRYERLNVLVRDYGLSLNLGNCFDTAERKTNIEIGLVKLYKPVVSDESKFEGFFLDDDEVEEQVDGIMRFNEVRALVNRYVGAMKVFSQLEQTKEQLKYILSPIGMKDLTLTVGYDDKITNKEDFSKHLQKVSWNHIFDEMKIKKYVTSGVLKDINKFVEQQHQIPFTMKNVYKMFDIIMQTRGQNFEKAILEVIDKFTMYTHENRFAVEGWKTNSGYMLNKKFIINYICSLSYKSGLEIKTYERNFEHLEDLTKVLCSLTGVNYDDLPSIAYASCDKNEHGYLTINGKRVHHSSQVEYRDNIARYNQFTPNQWYSWGFFDFKVFKKGTMHLKFKDENTWYLLNQAYGKLKGFTLAEKYK